MKALCRSYLYGIVGQVADLERQLLESNQRCAALEARQGLLEKELVMAEGGEVRGGKDAIAAFTNIPNNPSCNFVSSSHGGDFAIENFNPRVVSAAGFAGAGSL